MVFGIQHLLFLSLESYLEDQYQQVVIGNTVFESSLLHCGVPQGSVLGPILFLVYTHILALLQASHEINDRFCADDCHTYLPIANIDESKAKVLALLSDKRL